MKIFKHLIYSLLLTASLPAMASRADSLALAADKAPSNAALNLKAGRALYEEGRHSKARAYLAKGGNDAQAWLAMIEFDDYKFDEATERADKYLASKHNAESDEHKAAQSILDRADIASTMLDRVEKLVIIDSIVVDKDKFFKSYRLSAPTGRIASPSELPKGMKAAKPTTVYVSENSDRMLWGQPAESGDIHIVESSLLADGSWEQPHAIGDDLQLGGNANFPFLLSDGITLYYGSTGEGSLGGYDIYVTRNDGERYLQPQNIGMPYNSPMDDYLLAIDDATGIGWWATDRNLIPDSLTIYMFVPQELRDNYPVDGTPDLVDRARITSVAATRPEGFDKSRYTEALKRLTSAPEAASVASFTFALPDGRVITSLKGFTEPEAADLMEAYLEAKAEYDSRCKRLLSLRSRYAAGDTSLASEILDEEKELEAMQPQLRAMVNDVVKAETRP